MAEVEGRELLVLDEHKSDDGKNITRLRVVQWVYEKKDGSDGSTTVLEKRSFWINDEGQERTGKAKGLNHFDLEKVMQAGTEVRALLKGKGLPSAPPKSKAPAKGYNAEAPQAGGEDLTQVPF